MFSLIFLVFNAILFSLAQWWMSVWSKGKYGLEYEGYIKVFLMIIGLSAVINLMSGYGVSLFSIRSSTKILLNFLTKIIRSDIIHFDKLPIGMLLNRCLKDQ